MSLCPDPTHLCIPVVHQRDDDRDDVVPEVEMWMSDKHIAETPGGNLSHHLTDEREREIMQMARLIRVHTKT